MRTCWETRGMTVAQRYEYYTKKTGINDCWIWTGPVNKDGYGLLWKEGRNVQATRWAYETNIAHIPLGMLVCHTCDNPPCQNPNHWFLGTHQDNMDDKMKKGRHRVKSGDEHYARWNPKLVKRGSSHPAAKLDEVDVALIKALLDKGIYQHRIAHCFNVSQALVSKIATGRLRRTG